MNCGKCLPIASLFSVICSSMPEKTKKGYPISACVSRTYCVIMYMCVPHVVLLNVRFFYFLLYGHLSLRFSCASIKTGSE